jgi:uncharacterized protein YbbK (DUF523 family)/uncharacterized protein YbgA (DUF1722 family)
MRSRAASPERPAPAENPRIRIGVSACLLGERVRFDGGHKHDAFLTGSLGPYVQWVPVCPEVEVGLGTPREPLRLVRSGGRVLMITTQTGIDYTGAMNRWARRRVEALRREDLSGYVLKQNSPSCGMERVKIYGAQRGAGPPGRGLFASALIQRMPALPVEEEGRLGDRRLRENFIERVFAYRRLTDLFASAWTPDALARFQSAHRMALGAHSSTACQELESLVARSAELRRRELRERYERLFMAALSRPATPRRHAAVLSRVAGRLRGGLDPASRAELREAIEEYRRGRVPFLVPLILVRHHVRVLGIESLAGQTYLDPHPSELMLRHHAQS